MQIGVAHGHPWQTADGAAVSLALNRPGPEYVRADKHLPPHAPNQTAPLCSFPHFTCSHWSTSSSFLRTLRLLYRFGRKRGYLKSQCPRSSSSFAARVSDIVAPAAMLVSQAKLQLNADFVFAQCQHLHQHQHQHHVRAAIWIRWC